MLSNTGAWTLAIGVPVVLAMIVVFFAVGRATFWKASALWRFVIGMAVMLTGALGIETLSNFLPHFGGSIEIASEEYLEMLGATVMLWAARDQALADLQETIATQAASSSVKEQKPAIGAYPIRHDAPAKKSA